MKTVLSNSDRVNALKERVVKLKRERDEEEKKQAAIQVDAVLTKLEQSKDIYEERIEASSLNKLARKELEDLGMPLNVEREHQFGLIFIKCDDDDEVENYVDAFDSYPESPVATEYLTATGEWVDGQRHWLIQVEGKAYWSRSDLQKARQKPYSAQVTSRHPLPASWSPLIVKEKNGESRTDAIEFLRKKGIFKKYGGTDTLIWAEDVKGILRRK